MTKTAVRLSKPALEVALRKAAAANGDWDRIAAVELLIQHESWLHRSDFRRHVTVYSDGLAVVNFRAVADWVDGVRASTTESAVLRLACSLAGAIPSGDLAASARHLWSLRSIMQPLGTVNAATAVEAVRYAVLGPAGGGGRS